MRVLMLNRADVHTVPGGDTVQMMETACGLRKRGVEVAIEATGAAGDFSGFDIVHVFNWDQMEILLSVRGDAPPKGPPVVAAPIFMFQTGHWYDEAVSGKWKWRLIDSSLGSVRGRKAFDGWQALKLRYGARSRAIRRNLTAPARLFLLGAGEFDYARRALGVDPRIRARCAVVPNGVVREIYEPKPKPNEAFYREYRLENFVFQAARIQSDKNQLGLIQALWDTKLPIVFAGWPSPYQPEYVERCYEMGKRRGNVWFIGPKPPRELAGIYALAGVHVLPSFREGQGLVSLEAAAAGCRVVSTSSGCLRDYLGDDAWYCDPRDPASIRRAVLGALRAPVSDRLRERVLGSFTWDHSAQAALAGYREVLG